jgi:hypothetical protein
MKPMLNLALLLILSLPPCGGSAGPAPAPGTDTAVAALTPVSLAELSRRADLIVLAQVRDTDYLRRRDIPVSGSAYLHVLIPYKGDPGGELIEVYERGLHEHECYFPNPTVLEEGRRYLVFLRRDPAEPGRFRGMPEGCAVDVLVDRGNRYAVRMPITGIQFADPLADRARPMVFSDPYAVMADESLSPALREAMKAAGQIVPQDPGQKSDALSRTPVPPPVGDSQSWRYTRGIELGEFRRMMALETPAASER